MIHISQQRIRLYEKHCNVSLTILPDYLTDLLWKISKKCDTLINVMLIGGV